LKEHRDIAKEQLQAQKGLAKEKLSKEQQRCHQLFRLQTSNRDATYEWYKERTEERAEDTCMWFLKHKHFQSWLKQKSGPLLVSADPGCGKSVLAKYLIDQGLPRSATICYFFFKSQDQDTTRQALCALLHQLFSLKPALIEHATRKYSENGEKLINNTASLWEILQDAVRDPRVGPVIIVLDALDECAESEFTDLMRHVHSQFSSDRSEYGTLKYLLTCRPYGQILSRFWGLLKAFPNIHIPGEEDSETISQEINHVISCRINQLALQKRLSSQIKGRLEKRLREASHRTYLWVCLVFDSLEKENFKKTPKGVELAVATLPRSVNEAYEQILSKTDEEPMVRRVLSIILAARRPLNLSEMNVAVNVGYESKSIDDLDLEDDKDFKTRLRSLCGLFVSIHRGSIYFLHQTAREFLLAGVTSSPTILSEFHWHHSFTIRQIHTVLPEICVLFLNLFNSNCSLMTNNLGGFPSFHKRQLFLGYSAINWGAHVLEADFMDDATIIPVVLKICDTGSKSYSTWAPHSLTPPTGCLTDLMVASYYGHHTITKLLLEKGTDINARDGHGRTPLSLAAKNGYEVTVKLLLEKGADIEAKDSKFNRTPLLKAARNGHVATVKLLLEKGAFTEAKDRHLRTPLWQATIHLHYATIQLLLEKGADTNCIDIDADTPLVFAIEKGNNTLLKLLLDKGASVEYANGNGETPLLVAVKRGFKDIVELLLEKGAAAECQNKSGETPLLVATQSGYSDMVKLLLEKGAAIECKNRYGQTPLLAAADWGHNDIIELLLKKGAAVECRNVYRKTPLIAAAQRGYGNIVKQLLEKGASVVSEDIFGQTALACAVENGHEAIVNILLRDSQDTISYS
jgi:ankyrin repeat protein